MKQTRKNKYDVLDDRTRNAVYLNLYNINISQIKRATKNAMYNGGNPFFKRLQRATRKRNSYKIYNY